MTINKLFAATAIAMLELGSAYLDRQMCKGMPKGMPIYFTDTKKKRKRKEQRAARRKNRK